MTLYQPPQKYGGSDLVFAFGSQGDPAKFYRYAGSVPSNIFGVADLPRLSTHGTSSTIP
jgi:hypothetical protein